MDDSGGAKTGNPGHRARVRVRVNVRVRGRRVQAIGQYIVRAIA